MVTSYRLLTDNGIDIVATDNGIYFSILYTQLSLFEFKKLTTIRDTPSKVWGT